MKFIAAALFALSAVVSAVPASKRATCTNPVVHIEWRNMTTAQRNSFHSAVKCLQTKKATNSKTIFNSYPDVHDHIFGKVHYVAQFLPWHRWFLWLRRLDLIDCGYTGPTPYWDWTKDNADLSKSPIWDATTGFGGNGKSSFFTQGGCVQTGPYSQNQFQLTYPNNHCLSRKWNIRKGDSQYSPATVSGITNEATYLRFSNRVEEGPHDAIHNAVAGDMAAAWSPNDALFFLHHQFIDYLWWKWQGTGARLQEYGGNTIQGQGQTDGSKYPLANVTNPMPMLGMRGLADIPVSEVMNTQAGSVCYTYQ